MFDMGRKFISITLLLVCISMSAFSQDIVKGEYYPSPSQKKFDGEWIYVNNSTTFKISLKSEKMFIPIAEFYKDVVNGYHSLSENGKVRQSSFGNSYSITSGGGNEKAIEFLFMDLNKNERGTAILELLPEKFDEAHWKLKLNEKIYVITDGNTNIKPREFEIPTDVIMKRVK
jgi:hypothetical protein